MSKDGDKARAGLQEAHERADPALKEDGAGESGGGPYPNPHSGKNGNTGRARDQGGQTEVTEKLPKK